MALLVFLLLGVIQVTAQSPAKDTKSADTRTLTELQKLQIVNAAQAVEVWQLKLQQVASELQKARDTLNSLLAAAQKPGYELNSELQYVKKTAADAKPLQKKNLDDRN